MVDRNKTYSLYALYKLGVFVDKKSFTAYKTLVHKDMIGKNILQANFMGENRGARFYIKGSNVLKYLKVCQRSGK